MLRDVEMPEWGNQLLQESINRSENEDLSPWTIQFKRKLIVEDYIGLMSWHLRASRCLHCCKTRKANTQAIRTRFNLKASRSTKGILRDRIRRVTRRSRLVIISARSTRTGYPEIRRDDCATRGLNLAEHGHMGPWPHVVVGIRRPASMVGDTCVMMHYGLPQ